MTEIIDGMPDGTDTTTDSGIDQQRLARDIVEQARAQGDRIGDQPGAGRHRGTADDLRQACVAYYPAVLVPGGDARQVLHLQSQV